jgi:hypothetical protein
MRYSGNSAWIGGSSTTTAERMLDMVCERTPVLDRILAELGEVTLSGYLSSLLTEPRSPWQDRGDLVDAVAQYASPLLGSDVAGRVADELRRSPVALTANHHGVDYFAQSVQGTLLFALSKCQGSNSPPAIPIFACGNIPMNNLTYPLGMLFYAAGSSQLEAGPRKVPIFPDRHKRTMVSRAPGYDAAMIQRAIKRIDGLAGQGEVGPEVADRARKVLAAEYAAPPVMSLESYSDQAVVLSHRLWKLCFAEPDAAPDVVVLELERLVATLLQSDLSNPESLASRVMFDHRLRRRVLAELDGERICWSRRNLSQRLRTATSQDGESVSSNGCGTLFFWGVDGSGRKVPLTLERRLGSDERLRGVDDRGEAWDLPFTPSALMDGLLENRLIPSLFTCYLTVALARGVTCLGGYYQAEYLPAIQEGIVKGLRAIPEYRAMAECVGGVKTDGYLSGMQTVMTRGGEDHLLPAGPLEIISSGGLTREDLGRIGALTLREAHLASMSETFADLAECRSYPSDWRTRLAEDCAALLGGRIVIK